MVPIVEELEVEIYTDANERCPFLEWRDSLKDVVAKAKIARRVERLSTGNLGDCKRLKKADGVWELRLDFGPGYRLYFGREGRRIVVLLFGGTKRTQDADIDRAVTYWHDYLERK